MVEYTRPKTVEEIFLMLQNREGSKVIAGGTDLIPSIRRKIVKVSRLVDITAVGSLSYITEKDGMVKIGALTTHSEVETSQIIIEGAFILAEACRAVGCLQIRNKGTLVGNIVNASPAADSVVALIALNGEAVISSKEGDRIKKIEDIFLGPGKTILQPDEIITELRFRALRSKQGGAFFKLGRRKGMAISIVNCAVVVSLNEFMETFRDDRIVFGSVGPTPVRARKAERALIGEHIRKDVISQSSLEAEKEVKPINDLRGSAEYRREMARILVGRAIWKAVERAKEK